MESELNTQNSDLTGEKKKFYISVAIPAGFVLLLWIITSAGELFRLDYTGFALYPRRTSYLTGIIFSPLLHSGFPHLISNSLPLIVLGAGIIYFYPASALRVSVIIYLLPSILVWLFARPAYHIGASGIVYGFVTFLFFSGVIRRDARSIALALLVTFLYGSLVWGILPLDRGVSYEAHGFGALTGIICAVIFRKLDPAKKYEWEEEV